MRTTFRAKIGVPEGSLAQARAFMQGLYRAFVDCDASLAEINPLILTGDGKVLALDAKFQFRFQRPVRHPDIVAMRDLDEEDPAEIEASKIRFVVISRSTAISLLVNGAGLAMRRWIPSSYSAPSPRTFSTSARRHRAEGHRGVQVDVEGIPR